MDLFAKKNPEKSRRTQDIKTHITQFLELGEDATVMVTELNCQDDDCPEVETVIAIFRSDQPKVQITLHSGVDEITDAEIERLCRGIRADQMAPKAETPSAEHR